MSTFYFWKGIDLNKEIREIFVLFGETKENGDL